MKFTVCLAFIFVCLIIESSCRNCEDNGSCGQTMGMQTPFERSVDKRHSHSLPRFLALTSENVARKKRSGLSATAFGPSSMREKRQFGGFGQGFGQGFGGSDVFNNNNAGGFGGSIFNNNNAGGFGSGTVFNNNNGFGGGFGNVFNNNNGKK